MRMNNYMRSGQAFQQGAVLVSGLIFLVVLTMFVLALVRGGTLEERLARNSRDQQVAREAAEAMLRHAEDTAFGSAPFDPFNADAFSSACVKALCRNQVEIDNADSITWTDEAVTRTFTSDGAKIKSLTVQPRYIVELIKAPVRPNPSTPCEPGIVKVTARAQGNGGAVAIIQSNFRFRVFSNVCD